MFKTGSAQRDYSLCSQYDDAIDLPTVPRTNAESSAEDVEAAKKIADDRAQKLKVARDRSEWSPLIKTGQKPTIFTFRHIPGSDVDWYVGQSEKIGSVEGNALLFRLALKSVENLGGIDLRHEEVDGHRLLQSASLDEIYAVGDGIGRKVVNELAGIVAAKTFRGVDPL